MTDQSTITNKPKIEYSHKEILALMRNGFILTMFNIDFLCFEYIIPIIGAYMMFYGCYLIKDHSTSFYRVFWFARIRIGWLLFNFLIDWTVLANNKSIIFIQIVISAIIICALFYHLSLAVREECLRLNLPPIANYFYYFIYLYLCNYLAVLLVLQIGLIGILSSLLIILINLIYIIIAFNSTSKHLTANNRFLTVSKFDLHYSRHLLISGVCYFVALISVILISNKGFFDQSEAERAVNIKEEKYQILSQYLVNLGVRQQIINDLSNEELNHYQNILRVEHSEYRYNINGGTLHIDVYILHKMLNKRLLVYYEWIESPSNRLYELIECNTTILKDINFITGASIYDTIENDKPVTYSLLPADKGLNNKLFPYVKLKLSNEGDNMRGYLAFDYSLNGPAIKQNGKSFSLTFYYQNSIFNLPYIDILDYMNDYDSLSGNIAFGSYNVPVQFE